MRRLLQPLEAGSKLSCQTPQRKKRGTWAQAEQPEQAQAAARGAEKEAGEPEQSSAAPPKGGEASAGPSGADKKEPAPGAKEADDTGAAAAAAAAQAPKADTQESGAKDAPAEAAKIGAIGSARQLPGLASAYDWSRATAGLASVWRASLQARWVCLSILTAVPAAVDWGLLQLSLNHKRRCLLDPAESTRTPESCSLEAKLY